jgi:hypothetical protein
MYVATVLTQDQMPKIEPIDVTAIGAFHVTYINRFGREQRTSIASENQKFCEGVKEAEQFIELVLKGRILSARERLKSRESHLTMWQSRSK